MYHSQYISGACVCLLYMLHSIFVVDWKKGKGCHKSEGRRERSYWTVIIENIKFKFARPSEWVIFTQKKRLPTGSKACVKFITNENTTRNMKRWRIYWVKSKYFLVSLPSRRSLAISLQHSCFADWDSLFSYYVYFILESLVLSLFLLRRRHITCMCQRFVMNFCSLF